MYKNLLCVQVVDVSSKAITSRLKRELVNEIETIAKEEGIDRSTAIQKLLRMGLAEYKMEQAVRLYRNKKVTLWKAAEMADISLRAMMEAIKVRDIPYQYDLEGLEEHVRQLLSRERAD